MKRLAPDNTGQMRRWPNSVSHLPMTANNAPHHRLRCADCGEWRDLCHHEQGTVGTVGADEAETGVPGDFLKQMYDRAYEHRGQSIPMTEREVEWLAEACDQNPISAVHRARGGELTFLGRPVELKEHA